MKPHRSILVFAGAVLTQGCSCGSPEEPTDAGPVNSSVGSSTTSTSSTSSSTTATSSTGVGGSDAGPPEPMPCPDWPGWETWDDFAPECPFCVPITKEALPPPIQWEPCPPESGFASGCRQMKADWPALYDAPFTGFSSIDVQPDGKVLIQLNRLSLVQPNPFRFFMVAEADGPVLSAFLDPRDEDDIKGCNPYLTIWASGGVRQGRAVFTIHGESPNDDLQGVVPEAVVGGPVDALRPEVLATFPENARTPATSDLLWGTRRQEAIDVALWGEPLATVFTSADAGGLGQDQLFPFHDTVFWLSGNLNIMGIMAYRPEKGAFPFIVYPGDTSHGAYALGTDGVNLVWIDGSGKAPGAPIYPVQSIMTSPFTSDPSALVPKRLRSYPSAYGTIETFAVGCGYAAHWLGEGGIVVVRLSDGVSWILQANCPAVAPGLWCPSFVYAVTCEEIFVRTDVGYTKNIARIRLDALGPEIPPD